MDYPTVKKITVQIKEETEMERKDSFWKKIGVIRRSRVRKKILSSMKKTDHPLTPKDLSERTGKDIRNISREVRKLEETGIIRCINPDAAKTRMYLITESGDDIIGKVLEIEQEQNEYREKK